MKKIFTLFAFCLFVTQITNLCYSQPTYQSSYYAAAGDSFIISSATGSELFTYDFAQTGTNYTWNYDTLKAVTQKTQRFVDPDTTGYYGTFALDCNLNCLDTCTGFNCLGCVADCDNAWNTLFNLAEATGDSLYLGVVTLYNLYKFYSSNSNAVSQTGFGGTALGVPLLFPYEVPDTLYDFPLQYGNQDLHYSSFSIDLNSLYIPFTYKHSQTRYNEAEGWGTLKTPYGTLDSTLKVKTIIYSMDTVIWSGDTFTLSTFVPEDYVPDSIIEYQWFRKKFGVPLLTVSGTIVNGDTLFVAASYIDSFRCFQPTASFFYLPAPVAYLDAATDSVEVNFTSLVLNTDSLSWDFGDTASGAANFSNENFPAHYYTSDGTYLVSLTGCNKKCLPVVCDTFILPVVVIDTTKVYADFKTDPAYPCFGDSVHFINKSKNDTAAFWDFGDGFTSALDSPKHLFAAAGTYNVMLIASNSFESDTAYLEIKIASPVTASFTYDDSITNVPILFTNTSTGTDTASSYLWTFTNGSPSPSSSSEENPLVTFNKPATAIACLSAYNSLGCKSVSCDTIPITECLTAKFSTGFLNPSNFCAGTTINLTNQTTKGSGQPAFTSEWQSDGVTFATTDDASTSYPSRGDHVISLIVTNGNCTDTVSKTVSIKENATVDAGSDTSICTGDSVRLNPGFDNGGQLSYLISWTPSATLSGEGLYPFAKPTVTTTYTLSVTFISGTCDGFATIKDSVTVNVTLPSTASVSISASDDSICAGTSVTYTASPVNGGLSPSYQWKLNGGNVGTNSDTYSISSLADGDMISCEMSSSDNCASPNPAVSNTIAMSVTNTVTPAVSIAASPSDKICQGDSVTFIAAPTNGGTTPAYQWKLNGGNVGSNSDKYSNSSLTNGDNIACEMTSSETCVNNNPATSNTITMVVNSLPNPVINQGGNTLSVTTAFSSYQWYANDTAIAGADSDIYMAFVSGDYYVIVTDSNGCSGKSNTLTVLVGIGQLQISDFRFQIAPNPFSRQTEIKYSLATDAQIKIELYNLLGQKIKTIADEKQGRGEHRYSLSFEDEKPEIYFLKMKADNEIYNSKLIHLK